MDEGPRVEITYCRQCRWLLRATWTAQELLTTFDGELAEVALRPGTGGVFEVRVGDGEWHEASLRSPLSETTWVFWRYDWPFEPGANKFEVRCIDGNGVPQIEGRREPHPSGATGIHEKTVRL